MKGEPHRDGGGKSTKKEEKTQVKKNIQILTLSPVAALDIIPSTPYTLLLCSSILLNEQNQDTHREPFPGVCEEGAGKGGRDRVRKVKTQKKDLLARYPNTSIK